MAKLTKRSVDATRPSQEGDVYVWDSELPGLGLRVKHSGAKSFFIQYRNRAGRSRRLTLGRMGVLTPDEAKKEARLLLAGVSKGEDPAESRKQQKSLPTFEEFTEIYLSDYAEKLRWVRLPPEQLPNTKNPKPLIISIGTLRKKHNTVY